VTNNQLTVVSEGPAGAFMPVMSLQTAAIRRQSLVDFTQNMMKSGTDYGVVPGTGGKPTLLKPGAEKLTTLFGLSPRFEAIERTTDWTGEDHGGEPFFYFQYRCQLWHGDILAGEGVGSCNSWEKKYRYRTVYSDRATEQDKAAGRLEQRTGKGGRPYTVYVVRNPDPADIVNTIDKMAQKRALIAATLIAVNASEFFTQDVEDMDFGHIIDAEWTETEPARPANGKATPPPAKTKPQPAQPAKPQPQPEPDTGPLTDDELVIKESHPRAFVQTAAGLLGTDEGAIKTRLRDLGYEAIPGKLPDRLNAYRKLRAASFEDDPDADGDTDTDAAQDELFPATAGQGAYTE
jgi:hypothetical protein